MLAAIRKYFWLSVIVGWCFWAVVHFVLVRECDINAWKLGGLAMYNNKVMSFEADIRDTTRDDLPIVDLDEAESAIFAAWADNARYFGTLVPPDELAAAVFRNRPTLHKIRVQYVSHVLRGNTSRLQRYVLTWNYDRETGGTVTTRISANHLLIDAIPWEEFQQTP